MEDDPGIAWLLYVGGDGPEIVSLGRAPALVVSALGASGDTLRIRRSYAQKHRIPFGHFPLIRSTLDYGAPYLVQKPKAREMILFWHDGGSSPSAFMLVVKATTCGTELWVKSFRRVRPLELQRQIKRLIPLN